MRRVSRPEDIPRLLSPGSLEQAMREARLLHGQYRVDVKPLSPGELPLPRRANPSGD